MNTFVKMRQAVAKLGFSENRSAAYVEYVSSGSAGKNNLQPGLTHLEG
jgi:hypothetical protein